MLQLKINQKCMKNYMDRKFFLYNINKDDQFIIN